MAHNGTTPKTIRIDFQISVFFPELTIPCPKSNSALNPKKGKSNFGLPVEFKCLLPGDLLFGDTGKVSLSTMQFVI